MEASEGEILMIVFGIPIAIGLMVGLGHGMWAGIIWGLIAFWAILKITNSE